MTGIDSILSSDVSKLGRQNNSRQGFAFVIVAEASLCHREGNYLVCASCVHSTAVSIH